MVADGGAKSAGGGVCTASSCPLYNSEEAYLIVESGHPWSRVVSSSIRGGTDHVEWIGFIGRDACPLSYNFTIQTASIRRFVSRFGFIWGIKFQPLSPIQSPDKFLRFCMKWKEDAGRTTGV